MDAERARELVAADAELAELAEAVFGEPWSVELSEALTYERTALWEWDGYQAFFGGVVTMRDGRALVSGEATRTDRRGLVIERTPDRADLRVMDFGDFRGRRGGGWERR